MMLKIAALLMFILLSPLNGFCELEGHGVVDESIHGIQLYQRPKVKVPTGWKEDEEAGQESQCLVLVPKKDSADPKTMIYALAVQKTKPKQSLRSFVKEDVEYFRTNNKKGSIKKTTPFQTAKGRLEAYQFSYPYKAKRFIQTVAYAEEGGYFITFTLTGKSPKAYRAGEKAFITMLSSYK